MSWTVVDLFSGCGGMSTGFARRPGFTLLGAVDVEHGKPSGGAGSLGCNESYGANLGLAPFPFDMSTLTPGQLRAAVRERSGVDLRPGDLTVLIACPPCTDFSRAKPVNHLSDGARNGLTARCGDFVEAFLPSFVVMENAREFIQGRQGHHFRSLVERLKGLGYDVTFGIHVLTRFGLPQIRERALVVASRVGRAPSIEALWEGYRLEPRAVTVARAFERLEAWRRSHPGDPMEVAPGFTADGYRRMAAIPADGGSWFELATSKATAALMTKSMRARWESGDLGSHPDVYGRMWWDRPAPTIKRECAHVGNGRYAHPVAHRLLTVREMATLNGFPFDYTFPSRSVANRYRHIGDAVPPVISYQLSALVAWMLTGTRPEPADFVLPDSCLDVADVAPVRTPAIAAA